METAGDKARNAASAERRADIVAAARELYEEQGLSKTSVQDITNRVGVTRSLFYHYFPDKEAVTSAVLDDYVADFIEATHYWNAQRHPGDIESALASVVRLMRLGVFEHDAFRRSLASRENAALYIDFVNRVADRVASYIVETTVRDYGALHEIRIEHVYETFYAHPGDRELPAHAPRRQRRGAEGPHRPDPAHGPRRREPARRKLAARGASGASRARAIISS